MAAALAFSLCASAQTQYVMQIKKNNGDIVRMNADEVQGITFESAPMSDRTALIDHVRDMAKGMAEQGGNFTARNIISDIANQFAKVLVDNEAFFKSTMDAIVQAAIMSAKDVEEGSELQKKGYSKYIDVSLDQLYGRYIIQSEGAPVIEPATQIEFIFPLTTEAGTTNCMTTIKAVGNTVEMVHPVIKDRTIALILHLPESIVLESGEWNGETFTKVFDSTINCAFEPNGTSQYVNFFNNKWELSGAQHSFIKGNEEFLPDENVITFSRSFDPVTTGQMTSEFAVAQNNRPIVEWKSSATVPTLPTLFKTLAQLIAAMKQDPEGFSIKDLISSLSGSDASLIDILLPLLAGSTIDNMEIWAMGDLGFKVKVTDIPTLQKTLMDLRAARYQHKGEAAIDALVQQLNAVTEGKVSCKALSQELPFKMVTEKFGIDYIPAPAVKFADEEDYVPMSELVDKETIQYTFNFINEIVPQMGANTQTMVEIFKTLMQIFRADEVE
jgi:hypothetical protein